MTNLPEYPARLDMWEELKVKDCPIVIYGMGNGADKLIKRLDALGIAFADVFASDGFVRGHSFHGIRVKSFSEICETYPKFTVLLSFGTVRKEVIDLVRKMGEKYDLYVPDMPVSEEEVYFDAAFYNEHYEEILSAYSSLADEESRFVFSSVIRYKLSGRIRYLLDSGCDKTDMYSLLPKEKIASYLDVGAYSGDTLADALEYFPSLKKATLIEPDKKTYKRLLRFVEGVGGVEISTFNVAAWHTVKSGEFAVSGNRNSSVKESSTHSFEKKIEAVELVTVDSLGLSSVDYIKYDVEGAEREALLGSAELIARERPALLVSLYHKSRDIFELVNMLRGAYPDYDFYIRRLLCLPAWEINLIMLPRT